MAGSIHELGRRSVLTGAVAVASVLARPAISQGSIRTLRVRPVTDLTSLDPVWGTSQSSLEAAYMAYDALYGLDASLTPQPQMVDGHDLSDDGLTWRFTLRDGLAFHDGETVRAQDAIASIARWAQRDTVGVVLKAHLDEMHALDDRRFEIRLKKPFPRMLFSLARYTLLVMPERVAGHTDAFTMVKDHTGSGPFVFLKDEWVSGSRAAFRRNERYVPRQEKPSLYAGGKAVHFDRVEWITIPDPATAMGAISNGEIDWWENPVPDLLPKLRKSPGVIVEQIDPIGLFGMLVFNTKIPPFDNAKLRRALLFGVNQSDCMQVVVGSQPALMRTGVGVFPPGTPLATDADMDVLTTPRDLDQVRRLVQESGYKGERIAMMVPTDSYALSAFGNVIHQMMTNVGLNMDYQSMDWATLVSRRNQVETGGWNCYSSNSDGLSYMTPGTHWRLLATAPDPRMVALKQAWFNAPDLATQRQVAEQVQRRFFEDPPFLPLGQYLMPWAYRAGLTDIVHAPQSLFWGMRRA